MPKDFGEIDQRLLADTLDGDERVLLGSIHPSFLGGEHLPDYRSQEVEIARIVTQSATQDVFSLRARGGSSATSQIRYRLLDEYEAKLRLRPASSMEPLSLEQLVHLIDTASSNEFEKMGWPLVESFAWWQLEAGESSWDAIEFVSVESSVYPQLDKYYNQRLRTWAIENAE